MNKLLFSLGIWAFSFGAHAETRCGVTDAKIIDFFQYFDGQIFAINGVRLD